MLAGLVPALATRRRSSLQRKSYWLGACLLLLLAIALADHTTWAIGFVAAAAASVALGLSLGPRLTPRAVRLMAVAAAALLAAAAWEVSHRQLTARYLERDVTPLLGPPSSVEKTTLSSEVKSYFEAFDLAEITAADPRQLDDSDLAYALWTRSPLADGGRLSSMAVVVYGVTVSQFQFGVPLTRIGDVDGSPELWQDLDVPGWQDSLIFEQAPLTFRGDPVGTVVFALLPRPGFRIVHTRPEQLAATLVRGTLATDLPIRDIVSPGSFAIYGDRPLPALGPTDAPALTREALLAGELTRADTGGRMRGWVLRTPTTSEVILLPDQGPLLSLERVGVQALGTLLVLVPLAILLASAGRFRPGEIAQRWRRLYRSYSRKLLLVYGTMLLVPLLAVTLVLLGVLGERLERTRRVSGEAAIDAAQHVLGEYILSLEAGFGVDSALDDSLLSWLSRVVHHEVNLYWGSDLLSSSNPELFTAGLLPSRVPGEVYARLSLESASLASRVNRASGEDYLELYAPVRVPGAPAQELFFLSIPLLAQQEEVQDEIAALRTRAVLAALVLLFAVIAVAKRLSRGFTQPLTDLIAGTERIAAGASSLELEPTELELAALVDAVNSMARRIANARERLTVEKQVVEKVVENIAAGVVSLDRAGRVVLRNGVARELLGVAVGDSLRERLGSEERWRPLTDFLDDGPTTTPRQRTLRLADDDGEDREWALVWVPLPGEGEPTSLLVVEDVTEVLRGQRLEAWAEMARMIAHEIKNPLTPIRLSTEHMVEVRSREPHQFDEVFERCSSNILHQVEELQQIASEFSTYSRIPEISRADDDLVAAARKVVDSYGDAPSAGVRVRFDSSDEQIPLSFDRRLLGRALRNLIENALRASRAGGEVVVSAHSEGDEAVLTVEDRGKGVDAETLLRMFDPYFSTDSSGTGLGLPISRRIVEEHGGQIGAERRSEGGLRVAIRLPRSPAA